MSSSPILQERIGAVKKDILEETTYVEAIAVVW